MTKLQRIALRPILLSAVLLLPGAGEARERPVFPSGMGLQRLPVDSELIMSSTDGSLNELRLRDAKGHEVPYLIFAPSVKEAWQAGRVEALIPGKTTSGFDVDLGKPLATARMRLNGLPGPFHKRCQLLGSLDRQNWKALVVEMYLYSLQDDHLRLLELPFARGQYRYLRLTWDDAKGARLPLPKSVEVDVSPEDPPPSMGIAAQLTPLPGDGGVSRFQLRLPGPHLPLKSIQLVVAGDSELLREVRVSEPADGKERVLGSGQLRRIPQGKLLPGDLNVPVTQRPSQRDLELRVEDGKSPPIVIQSAIAMLQPLPWILFESSDGKSLTATYGDAGAGKAEYNLAALQTAVTAGRPGDALWGSVRPAPTPFYLNRLLWAALAAVVVLALGLVLWRRNRAPAPETPAAG